MPSPSALADSNPNPSLHPKSSPAPSTGPPASFHPSDHLDDPSPRGDTPPPPREDDTPPHTITSPKPAEKSPENTPHHAPTAQDQAREAAKNRGKAISHEAADKLAKQNEKKMAGQSTFNAAEEGEESALATLLAEWREHKEIVDWENPSTICAGCTPLMVACKKGHVECARMLLAQPLVDAGRVDAQGRSACLHGCEWPHTPGQTACIRLLLETPGAFEFLRDKNGDTPVTLYLAPNPPPGAPNPPPGVTLYLDSRGDRRACEQDAAWQDTLVLLLALDLPFRADGSCREHLCSWPSLLSSSSLPSDVALGVARLTMENPAYAKVCLSPC